MRFSPFGENITARRLSDPMSTDCVSIMEAVDVGSIVRPSHGRMLVAGDRFAAIIATPLPGGDLFVVHADHVVAFVDGATP